MRKWIANYEIDENVGKYIVFFFLLFNVSSIDLEKWVHVIIGFVNSPDCSRSS